jgi:hypothetical protein
VITIQYNSGLFRTKLIGNYIYICDKSKYKYKAKEEIGALKGS